MFMASVGHLGIRRLVLRDLLRERAVGRGEIKLSSGRMSDWYVNCKSILTAIGLELVAEQFHHILVSTAEEVRAVGGLTMGADPWTTAVSLWSRCYGKATIQPFFVRKEPKQHGTKQYVEAAQEIFDGRYVAIIDDVVTTGRSALLAIERSKEAGLVPVLCLTIVDREEDNGRQNIEASGIPVVSLFTRRDLLDD